MNNPANITEGEVVYSLGIFDGQTINYDFSKMLIYLNAKGKLLFGKKFRIYRQDRDTLRKLCVYFIKDQDGCKKFKIDPNKGLLLSGPIGCGKTSLIRLLKHLVPHRRGYEVISCRNIVFGFNHIGYKTVEDYGNSGSVCLDGLGMETRGRYYGTDCNVIGEILVSRYDLFQETRGKLKTYATTNLNFEDLEAFYGPQVTSRMKQFFNIVAFHKNSKDKRR